MWLINNVFDSLGNYLRYNNSTQTWVAKMVHCYIRLAVTKPGCPPSLQACTVTCSMWKYTAFFSRYLHTLFAVQKVKNKATPLSCSTYVYLQFHPLHQYTPTCVLQKGDSFSICVLKSLQAFLVGDRHTGV